MNKLQLGPTDHSKKPAPKAKDKQEETESKEPEDTGASELDQDTISMLKGKKQKKISPFVIAAPVVIIAVFLVFVIVSRMQNRRVSPGDQSATPAASSQTVQAPSTSQGTSGSISAAPSLPSDIGTQDFTQNTTMESNSPLTNPDQFLEDLYGLTTNVDYTVKNISNATDFVEYTKYRGTWGGGIELYWLNVKYKGRPYVIQVPFRYYKELSETGIVPVKMEVLQIVGSDGDDRTVISYMELDEETLKAVLKTQQKG